MSTQDGGAVHASEEGARFGRLARVAGRVYLVLAVAALALAAHQIWRWAEGSGSVAVAAMALGAALLLAGALRLPPSWRIQLLLAAVPVLGLLAIAELVATALAPADPSVTERLDLAQQVRLLRQEGHPDAVPPSRGWAYLDDPLIVLGRPTVPLAGLPDSLEVLCQEHGEWRLYPTDRMGFTNPDAVWNAPADIVIVGDSFAQGFCVPVEQSFASRIRARHPATINLGSLASGPLLELGTLAEYLPQAHGRLVLWFFYEYNDLADLVDEAAVPILRDYLTPGTSQDLLGRREALQAAQRERVEGHLAQPTAIRPRSRASPSQWLRFLRLGHLRARLGWVRRGHPYQTTDTRQARELFPLVVARMRQEADAVGARLVLVYLPGRDSIDGMGPNPLRSMVLEAARAGGLEVVDLAEPMSRHPQPQRLYSRQVPWSHLSSEGNRVVAEAVLDAIERGGWIAAPAPRSLERP